MPTKITDPEETQIRCQGFRTTKSNPTGIPELLPIIGSYPTGNAFTHSVIQSLPS